MTAGNKKISSATFTCDADSASQPLPHFWEHTVGSCHAYMALRADWQQQLLRCTKELGFKHVRFHGLLNDDMCTLVEEEGKLIYSFFNADQIIDFLLSVKMRPFVELSFMPCIIASGNKTVFHYRGNVTPPKNYNDWEILIYKLVSHWVKRYGIKEVSKWFFEVWNEPDLKAFWTGTRADYFKLYKHTAKAIKRVHPDLKVGGPATAKNSWITAFINFSKKYKVPVDFISTHHYPTDSFGKPGDDTINQLAASKRSILRDQAVEVKKQAGDKPVYYTEWNSSSNPFDDLHDKPYAAAFIIKTIMEARGLVKGYSYWTFSDIFEENYFSSVPFHGGFGLLTIHGIPKPAYRAFEFLHRIGNKILPVKGSHSTVDVWIVRNKNVINIIITNWALPRHPIKNETVEVKLTNIKTNRKAFIERIDKANANAGQAWVNMGSPGNLNADQIKQLEKASVTVRKRFNIKKNKNEIFMYINVPAQAVVFVTLEKE